MSCCAVSCANRYKKASGLGFFRFPSDLQRRKAWVKAVSRAKWCPSTHDRLCGDHFVGKKPSHDPNDIDYVPTIFADRKGQRSTAIKRGGERLERLERRKQRRLKELEALAAAQDLPNPTDPGGFFFWTRFKNLVAKRRKINDRIVLILVAIRNWNDVMCLSRY